MRTGLLFLLLVVSQSLLGLTDNELRWQKDYYRIKASKLKLKEKTDSVFLVFFAISNSNVRLLDELSSDFIKYSQKQSQVYGKAYLSKSLGYLLEPDLKAPIYYCKKSLSLFKKEKDTISYCFTLQLLAGIYKQSGNYDLSIKKSKQALKMAYRIKNGVLIANTYNDLGLIMSRKQNYPMAKNLFLKSIQFRLDSKEKYGLLSTYTNLGIVYKNLRQYDSAFYFQRQSLQLAKTMNSAYSIAFAYHDLGVLHLTTHQLDSAGFYFLKAVKLRKEIQEKWELGYSYNYLGELYRLTDSEHPSLNFLRNAVSLGKQTGNYKQLYESYEQMSLTFAQFKHYDSAFYYHQKFERLKDSITKQTNNLSVESLIADYEFENKQQEIKLLRNQTEMQAMHIEEQKNWLWITGLGVLSLIGFIVLFVRNRQLRLIKVRLESQQKEELLRLEAQEKIQEDRKRISRELHDNIGANLTVFKELVSDSNSPAEVSEIKQLTEETIQELRKSVWLLNHEESTFEEWIIRLREYFKHLRKVQVKSISSDSSNPSIHATVLTELFRVIQEGVNNALKHASCSEILVTIRNENQLLQISIEDNGIGISDTDLPGFGLINMKERIANIAGEITVKQSQEKGTRILISIPLNSTK